MLIFDPSKMKFFKKDGDDAGAEEDEGGVKTFFDTLDLGKGGGGSSDDLTDEEKAELEKKKKAEGADDDDDESILSPEMIAMQEQLKTSQDQTAKLMQLLEKKNSDDEEEEKELENPFESDAFDNYAKAMDWDEDEKKAQKTFLKLAFDYQNQSTLTTATASIDNIVNSKMSQASKKKAVQKQFFTENPKLKPVKDYVSTVASGVMKEYQALGRPLNPAEILKEAASRAYKVLGIDPKAKEKDKAEESESDPNPAFPSSKGNSKKRNQKVNKTTTQKMITSMIDL